MEAMGRYFAKNFGLQVICLRIGNVNAEEKPKLDVPNRWLSHRDLGQLISKALDADFDFGHF